MEEGHYVVLSQGTYTNQRISSTSPLFRADRDYETMDKPAFTLKFQRIAALLHDP